MEPIELYDHLLDEEGLPTYRDLLAIADAAEPVVASHESAGATSIEEYVASQHALRAELPVDMREHRGVSSCVNGLVLARRLFPEALARAQRFVSILPAPFNQVVDLSGVFLGIMPNRLGKANVRQTGSGYLVLVDGGVMSVIASLAEILSSLCSVRLSGDHIEYGVDPLAYYLKDQEARSRIFRIFSRYASDRAINTNWLPLPQPNAAFAYHTANCALQFAFHHELAHVVLGHCDDKLPILAGYEPAPSDSKESVTEKQADLLALMMGMCRLPGEAGSPVRAAHILAGAELVCRLSWLFEIFAGKKMDPTGLERLAVLRAGRGEPWAPATCTGIADLFHYFFELLFPDGMAFEEQSAEDGPILVPVPQMTTITNPDRSRVLVLGQPPPPAPPTRRTPFSLK